MTLDVNISTREGRIAWLEHVAYTPVDEIDPDSFQYLQSIIRNMLPDLKAGKEVIANYVFLWELEPPPSKKGQKYLRDQAILKRVEKRVANGEKRAAVEAEIGEEEGLSGGTVENIVKKEKRNYFLRYKKEAKKNLRIYGLSDSDIRKLMTVLTEDDYLVDKSIVPLILDLNLSRHVSEAVLEILDNGRVNIG